MLEEARLSHHPRTNEGRMTFRVVQERKRLSQEHPIETDKESGTSTEIDKRLMNSIEIDDRLRTSWRFTMRRSESQNSRVHYDVTSLESWETWRRAQHRMCRTMLDEMTRSWNMEVSTVGTRGQRNRLADAWSRVYSEVWRWEEQFCLKEYDHFSRRSMTLMTSCGIERNRLLSWSSRPRGVSTNLCCPEVIVYSAFSQCCSISLCSFLVSRTNFSRAILAQAISLKRHVAHARCRRVLVCGLSTGLRV